MADGNRAGEVILRNVLKTAHSKKSHTVVLKDCSLAVEPGKLSVMIGPSGCGKTTTINLIAGYERPDRGEVLLDGHSVTGPSRDVLVVFQETALFPWQTCYENVVFGPNVLRTRPKDEIHAQAMTLLEKVGLSEFADKYPMQLSGGMQRRAELARALLCQPKVMLMDEPFRGLDAMTRKLMQEYYLNLFEETHITNLFVTSELEEAIFLADRLFIMTNKPTRVKQVLEVDLPRPRTFEMLTSKRYREIKAVALELLHEEALKASATSGKADLDLDSGFRKLKEVAK